jgi:hypothetical protein
MKYIKLTVAIFSSLFFNQVKASEPTINNRVLKIRNNIKEQGMKEELQLKEGSILNYYISCLDLNKSDNSASWPSNDGNSMNWHNNPMWQQKVDPFNQSSWRNWNKF